MLYNALGQQLMEIRIEAGSNQIDVSMLPEGMYFLKMNGGKTVKVFKE